MGKFEKGALSAVVYIAVVALAAMVPNFASVFYLASWFAGLFGLIAFIGGLKDNCRSRAYLGGAAVLNFTLAMGMAYALWPLAIVALFGTVICMFFAARA